MGFRAVVLPLIAAGVISFAHWAHHMFTAGLGAWQVLLVSAASLVVAVPTAMLVSAWIATLCCGQLRYAGAASFLLGFLCPFVLGGRTWLRTGRTQHNPWRAGTLGWLPTGNGCTRSIPQVASRDRCGSSPPWRPRWRPASTGCRAA